MDENHVARKRPHSAGRSFGRRLQQVRWPPTAYLAGFIIWGALAPLANIRTSLVQGAMKQSIIAGRQCVTHGRFPAPFLPIALTGIWRSLTGALFRLWPSGATIGSQGYVKFPTP